MYRIIKSWRDDRCHREGLLKDETHRCEFQLIGMQHACSPILLRMLIYLPFISLHGMDSTFFFTTTCDRICRQQKKISLLESFGTGTFFAIIVKHIGIVA